MPYCTLLRSASLVELYGFVVMPRRRTYPHLALNSQALSARIIEACTITTTFLRMVRACAATTPRSATGPRTKAATALIDGPPSDGVSGAISQRGR
jgi:hypothetical protein